MNQTLSRGLLILSCVGMFCSGGMAQAQECTHYGAYSHWVGGVNFEGVSEIMDFVVSGTTAYCLTQEPAGVGGSPPMIGTLRVLDISNPAVPVTLGSVSWPNGDPQSLAVSGSMAYVTDGPAGLRLVDITNPSSPVLMGQVVAPGAVSYDVAVSGTLAYVTDGNQGLHVVDVANPNAPVIIGGIDTPGMALGLAMAGSLVFVADYSFSGLQVIDCSNPNVPVIIGNVVTTGSAVDVTLSGSIAYLADGPEGVQLIDVSNPASPSVVGHIGAPVSREVTGITVMGTQCVFSAGYSGVFVYDVSNASTPVYLQYRQTSGRAHRVTHSPGSLIFATYVNPSTPLVNDGGYDEFYISSLQGPPLTGSLTLQWSHGIAVSGPTAFLAQSTISGPQLVSVDVSDPTAPQQLGQMATSCYDVEVSGTTVYLAAGYQGFKILDASNPQQLTLIATVPETTGYEVGGVEVNGSHAYVAHYGAGFHVFDVADPANPINVGNLQIPSSNVRVFGSRAYLANGIRLVLVDVTDPASPIETGSVYLPSRVVDMVEYGTTVFAATEYRGLQIVNVSDPTQPVIVGAVPLETICSGISLSGSFLYLATGSTPAGPSPIDLLILDISEPTLPKTIGNIERDVNEVAVEGSHIFWAGPVGLEIAPIQCEAISAIPPESGQKTGLLGLAYPNPVRGEKAMIPFSVPHSGRVELRVYDLAGREVRTLVDETLEAGERVVLWDGSDSQGQPVSGGIYFYRLRMPGHESTMKLVRTR